jgi:hypothetical protein
MRSLSLLAAVALLAALALIAPLAPASACPWHSDMFGGAGGYMMEPVGGGPTDLQAAQPVQSREDIMARQRELFLARYPQLAAGAAGAADRAAPVVASAQPEPAESNR